MAVLRITGLCIHTLSDRECTSRLQFYNMGRIRGCETGSQKDNFPPQARPERNTRRSLCTKSSDSEVRGGRTPYDFRMQPDWVARTEAVMREIADELALADTTDFL